MPKFLSAVIEFVAWMAAMIGAAITYVVIVVHLTAGGQTPELASISLLTAAAATAAVLVFWVVLAILRRREASVGDLAHPPDMFNID